MDTINTIQFEIMEYLGGWFGFLTTSQIMELTGKSGGYVREMVGNLVRRGYVRSFRLEVSYKVRSENMYTITPSGAEVLQSHTDIYRGLKMPISSSPLIVKDYMHRAGTVSCAIKMYLYMRANNIGIRSMLFYFDKLGSTKKANLTAKTALHIEGHGSYIADAIIQTDKNLFLAEYFCDRDKKRCLASLAVHAKGIAAGTPSIAYGITVNAYVLSVFAHKSTCNAVIKYLQENNSFLPEMAMLFFFATLDDVKKSITTAWRDINGHTLVLK